REFENALLVGGRGDHKTHRKIVRTGKRRRHNGKHLNSRYCTELGLDLRQIGLCRRLADTPRLQNHSSESVVWECKLKREPRIGNVLENFSGSIRVTDR